MTTTKKYGNEHIDYLLRENPELSTEDAISLLERHDGVLTLCMDELKRKHSASSRENTEGHTHTGLSELRELKLHSRVSIRKEESIIVSLPAWVLLLVLLTVLILSPWVLLIGAVVVLLTGCKINWQDSQ